MSTVLLGGLHLCAHAFTHMRHVFVYVFENGKATCADGQGLLVDLQASDPRASWMSAPAHFVWSAPHPSDTGGRAHRALDSLRVSRINA